MIKRTSKKVLWLLKNEQHFWNRRLSFAFFSLFPSSIQFPTNSLHIYMSYFTFCWYILWDTLNNDSHFSIAKINLSIFNNISSETEHGKQSKMSFKQEGYHAIKCWYCAGSDWNYSSYLFAHALNKSGRNSLITPAKKSPVPEAS